MKHKPVRAMITDLDNTLYDWLGMWYKSFSALLGSLLEETHIPRDRLLREIRDVHRKYGTTEYAFLLQELKSLQDLHPNTDPSKIPLLYQGAIEAYRRTRRENLRLYPTVSETLRQIRSTGCLIVGYTESPAFYTNYRLRRLSLDGLLDVVYSPPDHALPANVDRNEIRLYPPESYELKHTRHCFISHGELKPNPKLLLDILKNINADASDAIYIGDSIMKDVLMAQSASVTDVYAKYGDPVLRPEYNLLRAVTTWTDTQVLEERRIYESQIRPSHVLDNTFSQVLEIFRFTRFSKSPTC
jgi:phosphoglycolate phosphatase